MITLKKRKNMEYYLVLFLIAFFLPHFDNIILSMAIKTIVICAVYLGLTYVLKIVPELHKYLPFHK